MRNLKIGIGPQDTSLAAKCKIHTASTRASVSAESEPGAFINISRPCAEMPSPSHALSIPGSPGRTGTCTSAKPIPPCAPPLPYKNPTDECTWLAPHQTSRLLKFVALAPLRAAPAAFPMLLPHFSAETLPPSLP